jgi:predicted enzyme related to lactoylglutathione lyase
LSSTTTSNEEDCVISGVSQVVIAVDDQDRAQEFWTGVIGFGLVRDETLGGERWIEVRPPDQAMLLVLSKRAAHEARPAPPAQLPHSNVFFTCDDIAETYADLSARGVAFPVPPVEMPWGWWSMFEDPEGTRFALGQHIATSGR